MRILAMKLVRVEATVAEGEVIAHSIVAEGRRIRKGYRLQSEDCSSLCRAQIHYVTVARFEATDLGEDAAARRIASAASGRGTNLGRVSRGRCDLLAEWDGLAVLDEEAIEAVNSLGEAICLSTLWPFERVTAGQRIGSCKVVPFALAAELVDKACSVLVAADGAVSVAPFRSREVALLQTVLPGLKGRVLAKTVENTDARVRDLGGRLIADRVVAHEADAIAFELQSLAAEGAELVLVVGASATSDRDDDLPRAVQKAGGQIVRLGMPVEPGNLSLVAWVDGVHVLGFPGSFRSLCLQGCDWLMQRIFAGLPVETATIARMGVGGLLKNRCATAP